MTNTPAARALHSIPHGHNDLICLRCKTITVPNGLVMPHEEMMAAIREHVCKPA